MQWHDATITTRVYFMWYYYTILCANVFKFAIITEKFLLNKWIKSIFTSQCCFLLCCPGLFLAPTHSCLWLSCYYTPLWSDQCCYSLYICFHRLGIVSGYGWIHNIYMSVFWAFLCVVIAFLDCLCTLFSLFPICQILLSQWGCS